MKPDSATCTHMLMLVHASIIKTHIANINTFSYLPIPNYPQNIVLFRHLNCLACDWIDQTPAIIQRPSANSACLCNSGSIAGTVAFTLVLRYNSTLCC